MKLRVPIGVILLCGLVVVPELPAQDQAVDRQPNPEYHYRVTSRRATRGQFVAVPIFVRSPVALSMVSWSLEFNPRVAQVAGVELSDPAKTLLRRMPVDIDFEWFVGEREGFVQASLIIDTEAREPYAIPPTFDSPVAYIKFLIRPEAPRGRYPLHFTRVESAPYTGNFHDDRGPVYNRCRRHGRPFTRDRLFDDSGDEHVVRPETDDGEISVSIIGDVGIFVRGDPNLDLEVDISDPVYILDHLFVTSQELGCPEAADVNRDTWIDISDPILLLDYLFMGSRAWRPTEEPVYGADSTTLGCDDPPIDPSEP